MPGEEWAVHMTHLGMKALIIEEQPHEPGWWILHLSSEGARWENAEQFAGMGVYEAAPALLGRFGEKVAISLIGPGGEMKLSGAGIQNIDKDRRPSRINARGGLGAVMGSKGLKAIVFDKTNGVKPPIADEIAFKDATRIFNRELMAQPQTQNYADYGTAAMTLMCNAFAHCQRAIFPTGSLRPRRRSAVSSCVRRCCVEAAPATRRTPVWPAAQFAARISMALKMGKRSSRLLNTRLLD